jgi:hypothetical protein
MEPKNKKSVLVLIIILMIIVLPCAGWGTYKHFVSGTKASDNNVNKSFKYNNKLYFYNNSNLIGTYACTKSNCNYASETIDDSNYDLNYYNDNNIDQVKMINNKYAFLIDSDSADNNQIILYDIINNRISGTFSSVKDYTIGIENNYYIIKNTDGLWGVVSLNDTPSLIVPYSYNYIGLHNIIANNSTKLEADIFAVKDTTGWKLISNKNVDLTKYFSYPIYDYSAKYVALKNNNLYYLYDYSNNLVISFGYKDLKFIGEYVGVVNSSNQFYLLNPNTTADASKRYNVNSIKDVTYNITNSGIQLSINGTIVETVK